MSPSFPLTRHQRAASPRTVIKSQMSQKWIFFKRRNFIVFMTGKKLSGSFSFRDLSDVRQRLACGKIRRLNIFEVAAAAFLARSNSSPRHRVPKLRQDGQTTKTSFNKMLIFPKCETCNHFISV